MALLSSVLQFPVKFDGMLVSLKECDMFELWPERWLYYDVYFLWRYSHNLGLGLPPRNSPFHFGFLDLRHLVGLLGRVISSSQGLYLYTSTEKAHTNTKHPRGDSNPRSRLPSERRQCMP
jgi:hypothetical protein